MIERETFQLVAHLIHSKECHPLGLYHHNMVYTKTFLKHLVVVLISNKHLSRLLIMGCISTVIRDLVSYQ